MPFAPRPRFTWRLRTRSLPLGERTLLMAILNLTPDSFSGDGLAAHPQSVIVDRALALLDDGADILDLGAESTRPGAIPVPIANEQKTLLAAIKIIHQLRPQAILSVDTYHADTALKAAQTGAEIINDVSGATWDTMMPMAMAKAHGGNILSHTRGRPSDWLTQPPLTPPEIMPLVLSGLRQSLATAAAANVPRETIVVDPGFGFGKRGDENLHLLNHLDALHSLGHPILAGLSRKHFLAPDPAARLHATQTAGTAAILAGAHILRVHDLPPARQSADLADRLLAH